MKNKFIISLILFFAATFSMFAQTTIYEVTANKLNVRQTANSQGKVSGSLVKGDKVDVLSITGSWAKINYKNHTAYVSAQYLKKVEVEDKKPEVQKTEKIVENEAAVSKAPTTTATPVTSTPSNSKSKSSKSSNGVHFAKGDVMVSGGIGLATNIYSEHVGAMFSQKVSVDFGIANLGKRTTLGIGFALNNSWGDKHDGKVAGSYNYEYTSRTVERTKNGTRWQTTMDKTQKHHRSGTGTADATFTSDCITALANVSIHHQFAPKLEGYAVMGFGGGMMITRCSDFHNYNGFHSEYVNKTDEIGSKKKVTFTWSYNDLAHTKFTDGGDSETFCLSISTFCGVRYWLNQHLGVMGEVGLDAASFKGGASTLDLMKVGCVYKF